MFELQSKPMGQASMPKQTNTSIKYVLLSNTCEELLHISVLQSMYYMIYEGSVA